MFVVIFICGNLYQPLRAVQAHGSIRIQIWELTLQRLVAALSIIYTIYVILGNIYPENQLRNQFMLLSVVDQIIVIAFYMESRNLQLVMNASARLIYRAHKFCHITPLLAELHWLPVCSRIHYKIPLITFKILHGLSPKHLSDLISIQQPSSSSFVGKTKCENQENNERQSLPGGCSFPME